MTTVVDADGSAVTYPTSSRQSPDLDQLTALVDRLAALQSAGAPSRRRVSIPLPAVPRWVKRAALVVGALLAFGVGHASATESPATSTGCAVEQSGPFNPCTTLDPSQIQDRRTR